MHLPPPCDDDLGLLATHDPVKGESDSEMDPPLQALRHYDRAIEALVSTTYSGLSSPERQDLLASLCREKQRLETGGKVDDAR